MREEAAEEGGALGRGGNGIGLWGNGIGVRLKLLDFVERSVLAEDPDRGDCLAAPVAVAGLDSEGEDFATGEESALGVEEADCAPVVVPVTAGVVVEVDSEVGGGGGGDDGGGGGGGGTGSDEATGDSGGGGGGGMAGLVSGLEVVSSAKVFAGAGEDVSFVASGSATSAGADSFDGELEVMAAEDAIGEAIVERSVVRSGEVAAIESSDTDPAVESDPVDDSDPVDEFDSDNLRAWSGLVDPVWLSDLGEFLDRVVSGDASEVADLGVVAVGVTWREGDPAIVDCDVEITGFGGTVGLEAEEGEVDPAALEIDARD